MLFLQQLSIWCRVKSNVFITAHKAYIFGSAASSLLSSPNIAPLYEPHWSHCEIAHTLGLFYLQLLLLRIHPSRYSHGSHFHYFQVSATQKLLCHRPAHTIYKNVPCHFLFPLCCFVSFPILTVISLISPPPTRIEATRSFYCFVHFYTNDA